MQSIDTPIQQAEAGWFTRSELQAYLGVGKNAVAAIADRFSLTDVERSFDERDVWRRILQLEPVHDHGAHLLRIPLRDIHWVAGQVGKASSTIRNEIARGVFPFGSGVQLGALDAEAGPRLRRWCAPVFEAECRGIMLAAVRRVSRPTVIEDVFGLPPLDVLPELSPADIVTIEPPMRLRL
jgi:hypothetical protein